MVHRNIDNIEMPDFLWRQLNPLNHIRTNIAFDTETTKGGCFLISDSYGRYTNKKEFNDLYGLLSYLSYKPYRSTINWFYNLEYDTAAILHFLNFDDRKYISKFFVVDYEDFRIAIIPKKELKISKVTDDTVHHTVTFFDLAQFYNFKRLATLATQTNYEKVVVDDISQIDIRKYYSNRDYHKLINDRCVIDCKITVELADKLTNTINRVVGVNNYRSNASIARRYVLENISHNLKMPSSKLLHAALQSYHAGHIETCKLGRFDNIYNYDINSAYPYNIANLYETDGATLINKEYEPDSAYSFFNIVFEYYNPYVSPWWVSKSNNNYHVNGKLDTWVGKEEIEFLIKHGYDFLITKGFHIMKNRYTEQPFKELIEHLYRERRKAKDNKDEIQLVLKVILNSIYGVTLNTINKKEISDFETAFYEVIGDKLIHYKETFKATNMYNPVYGAEITANTRMKLFNDFDGNLKDVIAISTDGIYLQKRNNGVKISKNLGDYEYKKINEYMSLGSGRYFVFDNGVVNDKESRFRSIPKLSSEIYKMMQENKHKSGLEITREKPIKLKESVINKEYRNKFNEFRPVSKKVEFRTEKRFWFEQFETIEDVMNKTISSRPYNFEEL